MCCYACTAMHSAGLSSNIVSDICIRYLCQVFCLSCHNDRPCVCGQGCCCPATPTGQKNAHAGFTAVLTVQRHRPLDKQQTEANLNTRSNTRLLLNPCYHARAVLLTKRTAGPHCTNQAASRQQRSTTHTTCCSLSFSQMHAAFHNTTKTHC